MSVDGILKGRRHTEDDHIFATTNGGICPPEEFPRLPQRHWVVEGIPQALWWVALPKTEKKMTKGKERQGTTARHGKERQSVPTSWTSPALGRTPPVDLFAEYVQRGTSRPLVLALFLVRKTLLPRAVLASLLPLHTAGRTCRSQ